jgi:hypothetical protein
MTLPEAIETTRIHSVDGRTGDRTATADLTGVESIHAAHGAGATQDRPLDRDRQSWQDRGG